MKRLWGAAALLAVVLIASLVNAWYSHAFAHRLSGQLEQAQQLASEGDWEEAGRITRQVYGDWNAHHFYLHSVLRHSDTDEILRTFRCVLQYLSLEEVDQYAAANADLISQLELLAEMEQASLVNVL